MTALLLQDMACSPSSRDHRTKRSSVCEELRRVPKNPGLRCASRDHSPETLGPRDHRPCLDLLHFYSKAVLSMLVFLFSSETCYSWHFRLKYVYCLSPHRASWSFLLPVANIFASRTLIWRLFAEKAEAFSNLIGNRIIKCQSLQNTKGLH